ncbi:hypothetical protein [Hymenobacter latericus]|uniref:hypothetical protein n=1 Tax=Hymenobacter sp. YIM 151858-1 TaxID=2987688 RepID=UPI0022270300|nr:hypothetical protein [Hymenobacter sp. YIM 151858-1]UYZ61197.1 hypothetical protein OIS50_19705 [Hymenobacter sp. YIM 151858-1]
MAQSAHGQYLLQQQIGGSSLSLNNQGVEKKATSCCEEKKDDGKKTSATSLGFLAFSTLEKKADLNLYSYSPRGDKHDVFFGLSAAGEIKNDIASILKSGDLVTGASAKARFGWQIFKQGLGASLETALDAASKIEDVNERERVVGRLLDNTVPARDLWFVLNAGFAGSKFKRFLPDTIFDKQIQKETFSAPDLSIGLNYWQARLWKFTVLGGATYGWKRTNTFDKLDESTREDTRQVVDPTNGTTRKIVTKETVYTGTYKEQAARSLVTDLYLVPHFLDNVGVLLSQTTESYPKSALTKPRTTPSMGIFFLKDQNSFNPVVGLSLGFYDIGDNDTSDDDKSKQSKLSLSLFTRVLLFSNQQRQ